MKKIFVFIFLTGMIFAQNFTVENITGKAAYQKWGEEDGNKLRKGTVVENGATIVTNDKATLKLKGENILF